MWEQKETVFLQNIMDYHKILDIHYLNNTGDILVIGNPNADINGKINIGNIRVFI